LANNLISDLKLFFQIDEDPVFKVEEGNNGPEKYVGEEPAATGSGSALADVSISADIPGVTGSNCRRRSISARMRRRIPSKWRSPRYVPCPMFYSVTSVLFRSMLS
jgi:hypothetical protein